MFLTLLRAFAPLLLLVHLNSFAVLGRTSALTPIEVAALKYKIEFAPLPRAYSDQPLNDNEVRLKGASSFEFDCAIPEILVHPKESEEPMIKQTKLTVPEIRKMLQPMATTCLHKTVAWWTYEYCHGRQISQYHVGDDGAVKEKDQFLLGLYETNAELREESIDFSGHYSISYKNGDVCQNGVTREVQTKYICSQGEKESISVITETSMCKYQMKIHTFRACQHPKKSKKRHNVDAVVCHMLMPVEEINKLYYSDAKSHIEDNTGEKAVPREMMPNLFLRVDGQKELSLDEPKETKDAYFLPWNLDQEEKDEAEFIMDSLLHEDDELKYHFDSILDSESAEEASDSISGQVAEAMGVEDVDDAVKEKLKKGIEIAQKLQSIDPAELDTYLRENKEELANYGIVVDDSGSTIKLLIEAEATVTKEEAMEIQAKKTEKREQQLLKENERQKRLKKL